MSPSLSPSHCLHFDRSCLPASADVIVVRSAPAELATIITQAALTAGIHIALYRLLEIQQSSSCSAHESSNTTTSLKQLTITLWSATVAIVEQKQIFMSRRRSSRVSTNNRIKSFVSENVINKRFLCNHNKVKSHPMKSKKSTKST